MNTIRTSLGIWVSLAFIGWTTPSARADFTLLVGNNPQMDENVLLGGGSTGMQVVGLTNQTSTAVLFESSSQFLSDPSSGQARIEARASNDINADQVAIGDDLTISLQNPILGFQSLIVDAFIGGGLGAGGDLSFVVSGLDANGDPASETLGPESIGSGSNFFTLVATNGQLMQSVTVSPGTNSSYADLRQVRIGGVVPEPATWSLLIVPLLLLALGRKFVSGERPSRVA